MAQQFAIVWASNPQLIQKSFTIENLEGGEHTFRVFHLYANWPSGLINGNIANILDFCCKKSAKNTHQSIFNGTLPEQKIFINILEKKYEKAQTIYLSP